MGKSHESRQKQTRNTKEEPPCKQSGLDKMESGLLALLPMRVREQRKELRKFIRSSRVKSDKCKKDISCSLLGLSEWVV